MLIEAGANINAQDKNGETPLKNALDNKDVKSIKFLLERGADVNSHWNFGESFRQNPLYSAVNIGNIEAVKLLLDYGADRDIVIKDGREKSLQTPLMIAQEKNHTDVVELLQNYKGNNVVTFHGVKFQRVID
jgi:ankyrin repeat protein